MMIKMTFSNYKLNKKNIKFLNPIMKNRFTTIFLFICYLAYSCANDKNQNEKGKEQEKNKSKSDTAIEKKDTLSLKKANSICINDSLNELAMLIAGINPGKDAKILNSIFSGKTFLEHSKDFSKKWEKFDTSRIKILKDFREKEISKVVSPSKTLLYPFSGPDILYAYTFFPEAEKYVMMGLEPVGTRVIYDEESQKNDSLSRYFGKIKHSLHAILNFSFFRTASMSSDLKNNDVDGTQHLLLLFLARTGNKICEINPVYIDSTGNLKKTAGFPQLKKANYRNKGIEIVFSTEAGDKKSLTYFSVNLSNEDFSKNLGMQKYISSLGEVNSYFKGASYLMHLGSFSKFRKMVLNQSNFIIQDDSGIPIRYLDEEAKWDYTCYGSYSSPIKMFAHFYQKEMDTLYKINKAKPLGFGIGYKFKNNSSNLIIAKKQK